MHIDRIRHFQSSTFPVLSVYLAHSVGSTSASARLSDLLKPIKEIEESGELGHEATMSLRSDLKAVHGLADRIDAEPAPGVAVFASHGAGLLEYLPVSGSVWDVAMVGPRPYLRPLRALSSPLHTCVVVTDRRRAAIYLKHGTEIQPRIDVAAEAGHKENYGGFQGYEEHGARNYAEELTTRLYKEVAEQLFRLHKEERFDLLVVGGHQESVEAVLRYLHPYLRSVYGGSFVIDPHTMTDVIVREKAEQVEAAVASSRERAAVEELLEAAGSGNRAVLGIAEVLKAANAKAIDRLVVTGRYAKSGTVCDTCGWLARNSDACTACGAAGRPTNDLIAELMEATLAEGGEVLQVSHASQLDAQGVGARLRFQLPDGLV